MTILRAIRTASTAAATAVIALGGLTLPAPPAGAASGVITPTVGAVARGADLTMTASGCGGSEISDEGGYFELARIILIAGTGADARLAGFASGPLYAPDHELVVRLPGWLDPDQPAVLTGECLRFTLDETGMTETTMFEYADVAVDVTDAPAPVPGPLLALDRSSAAGGQVLVARGSGCAPGSWVEAAVLRGSDLSGRSGVEAVAFARLEEPVTGPFTIEIPLLSVDPSTGDGPLEEGAHGVAVMCSSSADGTDYTVSAPQAFTVVGTNPSGAITTDEGVDGALTVSGEGCTGGRVVRATFTGYAGDEDFWYGFDEGRAAVARAADPLHAGGPHARIAPDVRGDFTETLEVTPDADGRWTLRWSAPSADFYEVRVIVDCGDPTTDGFRYVEQGWFGGIGAPVPGPPFPVPVPTTAPVSVTVPPPAAAPAATAPGATPVSGTPRYAG